MASNRGFRKIMVQVDSRLVLQLVYQYREVTKFAGLLNCINQLKSREWNIQFCHVHREADKLANEGLAMASSIIFYLIAL